MIPFVDFKAQFKNVEAEIRTAIDRVLERGWYILGEEGKAFETEFAAYLDIPHAVGVGSGTDAIQLALWALGIGPGDEVITAANTCVPTVAAISCTGATPVPADIDPETMTLTADTVEERITPKTRAIVPVHLYGHPCDMAPILSLARSKNIYVVEDCAQAHGALYKGKKCGTLGDVAAFSFYPTKNLGAYGDAGSVVTADESVAERLRQLRNYGEEKRYYHSVKGANSRLDEIQAAILRVKLKFLDQWNAERRKRAALYHQQLASLPLHLPHEAPWAHHVFHLYVVRSPRRDQLMQHLKKNDIATLLHYPLPFHLQKAYADLGFHPGTFPHAEQCCQQVLSLPLYPELSEENLSRIAQCLQKAFL